MVWCGVPVFYCTVGRSITVYGGVCSCVLQCVLFALYDVVWCDVMACYCAVCLPITLCCDVVLLCVAMWFVFIRVCAVVHCRATTRYVFLLRCVMV